MNIYDIILKLAIAVIIGGAIGYEREYQNRPAGFRTHILVCIGAAVISIIQILINEDITNTILQHPELSAALKSDVGRLGAQVISGIGFLGAGTIIHEKGLVKGLTTAASLWVVACIGLAVGFGYYYLSILSAIFVEITLISLKKVEDKLIERNNILKLKIDYSNGKGISETLQDYFSNKNIKVKNIEYLIEDQEEGLDYLTSVYTILVPKNIRTAEILKDLGKSDELLKILVV